MWMFFSFIRVGDDNLDEEENSDEPRKMAREDFDYVVGRIDRMELSVASIISKVRECFFSLTKIRVLWSSFFAD